MARDGALTKNLTGFLLGDSQDAVALYTHPSLPCNIEHRTSHNGDMGAAQINKANGCGASDTSSLSGGR